MLTEESRKNKKSFENLLESNPMSSEDLTKYSDAFKRTIKLGKYAIKDTNDNSLDLKFMPDEI